MSTYNEKQTSCATMMQSLELAAETFRPVMDESDCTCIFKSWVEAYNVFSLNPNLYMGIIMVDDGAHTAVAAEPFEFQELKDAAVRVGIDNPVGFMSVHLKKIDGSEKSENQNSHSIELTTWTRKLN